MKILIIGSKGFIGTYVFKYFRANQIEVWGCDVVTDYNDPSYFQVDATNANYEEIFEAIAVDVCINCSGAASVPESIKHPLRDYSLNVYNVALLLEAIRKHAPTCKLVNLSSAAVYGNPVSLPIEETQMVNPLSPYGHHKLYAEMLCKEYFNHFNVRSSSLRIFSAFGPGLKKQIFWDWSEKVKRTDLLEVIGTGKESRDFIYIDDLVHAIECVVHGSSFEAEVINVANGEEVLISSAADIFKRCYPGSFNIRFNNSIRVGDPVNWKADISRLQLFGYKQKVSFEDGLTRFIQWAVSE